MNVLWICSSTPRLLNHAPFPRSPGSSVRLLLLGSPPLTPRSQITSRTPISGSSAASRPYTSSGVPVFPATPLTHALSNSIRRNRNSTRCYLRRLSAVLLPCFTRCVHFDIRCRPVQPVHSAAFDPFYWTTSTWVVFVKNIIYLASWSFCPQGDIFFNTHPIMPSCFLSSLFVAAPLPIPACMPSNCCSSELHLSYVRRSA